MRQTKKKLNGTNNKVFSPLSLCQFGDLVWHSSCLYWPSNCIDLSIVVLWLESIISRPLVFPLSSIRFSSRTSNLNPSPSNVHPTFHHCFLFPSFTIPFLVLTTDNRKYKSDRRHTHSNTQKQECGEYEGIRIPTQNTSDEKTSSGSVDNS